MRTIKDIIEYASDSSIVAKAIQRNHQTIYYWKRVPAIHVRTIEKLTGIPREELRPDIFGKKEWTKERDGS